MRIKTSKTTRYPSTSLRSVDVLGARCGRSINAREEEGALFPGVKLSAQTRFPALPPGVVGAYCSQGNGALYLLTDSAAYRISEGASSYTQITSSLSSRPFFVDMYFNGFSVTVFFNNYDRIIYTGMDQDDLTDDKRLYCGAMHCGRLFARDYLDGFKLWWAASHALDWTAGINGCGYTLLPAEGGDILRLFSYDDRLIAMRESGITIVRAYGDPQNYKVDATANYMTADGIIEDTCAEGGGKILFCTPRGIYAFDGSGIDRLLSFAGTSLSSPKFAAASGDMYCVVCTDGVSGGDRMYCFDLSSGSGWLTDISPSALFSGAGALYAVVGTSVMEVTAGGSFGWRSLPVRFGDGNACLKRVRAVCDGDVSVTVSSLGVSRTLSGSGIHEVNMSGRDFTFSVLADGKLTALEAQAEV